MQRFRRWVVASHRRIAALPGFPVALVLFFVAQLVVKLSYLFALVFLRGVDAALLTEARIVGHLAARVQHLGFADVAEILAGLVEGIFIALGVLRIRTARIEPYQMF